MTIEQAIEMLSAYGYTFETHDTNKDYFYVYLNGDMVNYGVSSSNLQRMDFVVDLVVGSKWNEGFKAGEKSKAEEIKNLLQM